MASKSAFTSFFVACLLVLQGADTASAYYSPQLGRFLSRDPIGQADSGYRPSMAHHAANSGRFIERDRPLFSRNINMYPDGANTYAGWFVPGNLDYNGKEITVITNTNSVGGAGHAATIIGNDETGYTLNSYGSGGSSGSRRGSSTSCGGGTLTKFGPFKTWSEAIEEARQQGYTRYYGWTTTPEQDAAAQSEADRWAHYTYNLFWRNCGDCARSCAQAGGQCVINRWRPTAEDRANRRRADYDGELIPDPPDRTDD